MVFVPASRVSANCTIDTDLCIVGGGIAGLALAREYLGAGHRVVVLEAGGSGVRHASQKLYRAEQDGAPNHSLADSRYRVFGGSGTRWTGQCVPLEPIDFESRDAIEGSGWPIGHEVLTEYHARAAELFRLTTDQSGLDAVGTSSADPDNGPVAERLQAQGLAAHRIRLAWPRDVGAAWRDAFEASDNVSIHLDAAVAHIETATRGRQVTGVHVLGGGRTRYVCRARRYVLACGGIENARLLLAANDSVSAGLGNEHDQVGRYFMDHPYLTTGYWKPGAHVARRGTHVIEDFDALARARGAHDAFTLPADVRRRDGLNACVGYFFLRMPWQLGSTYHAPTGQALVHLAELARRQRHFQHDVLNSLGALLRHPVQGSSMLLAAARRRAEPPQFALRMVLEATPCRDSRITLTRTRDALGLPRPHVHWRINDSDWRGLTRFRERLADGLSSAGLGTLIDDRSLSASGWPVSMQGGRHHMGTTRMHERPEEGVVDEHGRVHSVDNLYIAGSSVFTTGGWANPTLSLVALTLRLSDHLKQLS